MNFALLGWDERLLPLLRAIAGESRHRLSVAAHVPSEVAGELLTMIPNVRLVESWDEILNDEENGAVIAVPGDSAVDPGIKHLATAGKPILLLPESDPASSLAYELTLVRDDNRVALIPLFAQRFNSQMNQVRELILRKETGGVIGLQWNRAMVAQGNPPLLTRRDVYAALIYDVDALRQSGGAYSQVTAVFAGPSDNQITLATVTLAGKGLPTATWTLRPATAGDAGFEFTITADDGTVQVRSPVSPGQIPADTASRGTISLNGNAVPELEREGPADVSRDILNGVQERIASPSDTTDWIDYVRSLETIEAASRSIRRRRTIDLHFETTSERNQFKTQMTAIGCMLMSVTLFSVIFLLAAENVLNLHPVVMNIIWIGVFAPIVLFLGLQGLLFVARPSNAGGDERTNDSPTR